MNNGRWYNQSSTHDYRLDVDTRVMCARRGGGWLALVYRLFESADRRHVESGDDGHQRVEVAHVETLPGRLDPELDDFHPLLFLRMLQKIPCVFTHLTR